MRVKKCFMPPMSMWKHKKATAVLLGLILLPSMFYGVNSAYARHHHRVRGTDYPYDAAAYYSMTAISWADSAPSKYALKDLAGAGGNVIDLTRLLKSVLFGDDWENLTKMHEIQTEAYRVYVTPYDKDTLKKVTQDSDVMIETSKKMGDLVADMANLEAFHPEPMVDEVLPDSAYDMKAKLQQQEKTYKRGAEIAELYLKNQDSYDQATQNALEMVQNTQGQTQNYQALAHMQNLKNEQSLMTNSLAGALLNVIATRNAAEMDEEAREAEARENAMLNVYDPYSEREQKTLKEFGYEKYETKGMPDFKK